LARRQLEGGPQARGERSSLCCVLNLLFLILGFGVRDAIKHEGLLLPALPGFWRRSTLQRGFRGVAVELGAYVRDRRLLIAARVIANFLGWLVRFGVAAAHRWLAVIHL